MVTSPLPVRRGFQILRQQPAPKLRYISALHYSVS